MIFEEMTLSRSQTSKLLGAANADAALLYIYLTAGNHPENAPGDLHFSDARLSCALASLRQLGLWTDEKQPGVISGERPAYSETDVLRAMDEDRSFRSLYEEIQRLLGRSLNTEELKILLGFVRYLGMSPDVIHMLVCYCRERSRQKGSHRNPSLRTIEKEAYFWAEQGIDTVEEAAAFIQAQSLKNSRMSRLMQILQIRGRNLTAAEERYAAAWLEMGFEDSALGEAYERTCLNTGSLNWPYMNKILQRWHEAGLHTAEAVKNGDRKQVPKGGSNELTEADIANIRRMMQEG